MIAEKSTTRKKEEVAAALPESTSVRLVSSEISRIVAILPVPTYTILSSVRVRKSDSEVAHHFSSISTEISPLSISGTFQLSSFNIPVYADKKSPEEELIDELAKLAAEKTREAIEKTKTIIHHEDPLEGNTVYDFDITIEGPGGCYAIVTIILTYVDDNGIQQKETLDSTKVDIDTDTGKARARPRVSIVKKGSSEQLLIIFDVFCNGKLVTRQIFIYPIV
jgi:hypothetical protein